MDKETFQKLCDMEGAEETKHLFMRITQEGYYVKEKIDDYQSMYPGVRQ